NPGWGLSTWGGINSVEKGTESAGSGAWDLYAARARELTGVTDHEWTELVDFKIRLKEMASIGIIQVPLIILNAIAPAKASKRKCSLSRASMPGTKIQLERVLTDAVTTEYIGNRKYPFSNPLQSQYVVRPPKNIASKPKINQS